MSNNLSDIVNIQIQIAAPATSLSGFESILIVGPEPASKTLEDYQTLGVYTSLEGVKAAGWVEGEAVYDAAAVAFSQQVKPSQIYVADVYKRQVQHQMVEGEFVPNAPSTIRKKGSDKPLIDTGQLRQGVSYKICRKGEYDDV